MSKQQPLFRSLVTGLNVAALHSFLRVTKTLLRGTFKTIGQILEDHGLEFK